MVKTIEFTDVSTFDDYVCMAITTKMEYILYLEKKKEMGKKSFLSKFMTFLLVFLTTLDLTLRQMH